MRIYVIVILLILTGGFGSGNCLTAQDYSEQVETKELNAAFNSLLTSVKEVSAKKKYPTLQRFLEEHPGYARAYFALFDWYVFDEQLSQAKSYFHTLSTSSPHKQYCQWVLAKIHSLEEKPHAAFNAFVAAIEAGPPPIALIKDFIEFCSSHGQAFNSFEVFQRQNFDEELTSVIEAIQKYNNFEDGEALARIKKLIRGLQEDLTVLHIWGNCSISLSQFSEADSIWQRGLHIAKENENLDFEVQFLSNLGYLNERLSQFDLAHHYYNSAYELARRISSNSQTSSLAARLAFVFRALGDYDNAQAFFKEVIGRQESLAKKQDLAGWYRGYAMTLYYLGKYQESLGFLDKCEELLRNTNFSQRLILAKLDKATVLASLNQIHIAKKNLMEVMEIATTKNLEYYERTARAKLGDLLRQEGKYHEAREFYREFISYLNSNDNLQKLVYPWQVSFANTFFLEERYEEARKEYLKALKFAKETDAKTYQGWSLLHLGYIELILGDATRALEYYDSAREIATKQTNSEMLWKAYVGYGNARKGTGNIFSAISAYQKAAQLFEATRNEFNIDRLRVGYFIDGFQIYQNLVGCYLDLYENNPTESYLDSVFYYHELGRGRGLSELAENEKSESPGEGSGQVKQR
ncbi:MAG: tetratricopeptide repeat protein, partial [bacterium]